MFLKNSSKKSGPCLLYYCSKNKTSAKTVISVRSETPEHFLLDCIKYERERRELLKTLKNICIECNLLIITLITLDNILGMQNLSWKSYIFKRSIQNFVKSSKEDIKYKLTIMSQCQGLILGKRASDFLLKNKIWNILLQNI